MQASGLQNRGQLFVDQNEDIRDGESDGDNGFYKGALGKDGARAAEEDLSVIQEESTGQLQQHQQQQQLKGPVFQ